MKIAIFKRVGTEYPYETIKDEQWEQYDDGSYVRTSEYVDVEFPPLADDELVQKQIDALDKAETELRNKFQSALGAIEQQRAELRAITYRPE